MIEHQASLTGSGRRVGIVVSRFNDLVTRQLLAGARDALLRQGVSDDDIRAAWVPGAWEIPSALRRMAHSGKYDALIALGCVIRGATPHFDYVSSGVTSGVANLATSLDVPVIFGVLTTDTLEQALERAGSKAGNKGWDAAMAALEMANLFDQLSG
jgi:6,7-dimethyl-8-ribityllumazine synthase